MIGLVWFLKPQGPLPVTYLLHQGHTSYSSQKSFPPLLLSIQIYESMGDILNTATAVIKFAYHTGQVFNHMLHAGRQIHTFSVLHRGREELFHIIAK